eukprot:TRINITY_DN5891_c0_g1_i1.p1 TRINITY_DN5891_c0_g1~~TRINITY_DN5891_c0_g1_i1.p1  ORF type:complete len:419 (+),score=100.09 TRINITY_DN5891_c0_g1_i1:56-1312(+)
MDNLFILSSNGEILIDKSFSAKAKRNVCDVFMEEVAKASSKFEVLPIITTPKFYLIHTYRFGLFFLSAVQKEVSPLMILEAHQKIVETFLQYFGMKLDESVIKDNFSLIYQLLDEMIDGGFPSTTELNQLTDMIVPPSISSKLFQSVSGEFAVKDDLPGHVLSKIPWRKVDVKYVSNEIYFDIVEQLDCIMNANQQLINCTVYGDIKCNCRLSGMPDLTLSFTRPQLMEDVALHRCVRINRFQREKLISFVPPDGAFTLLSYRLRNVNQALPIVIRPHISTPKNGIARVSVSVSTRYLQDKLVEGCVLTLPLPKSTKSMSITSVSGTVKLDQITKVIHWDLGTLKDEQKSGYLLEGTFTMPTDTVLDELPTISAEWSVKTFCFTGLKVDGLGIRGVKYKPFKGVRSVTQAGKFQVRCS